MDNCIESLSTRENTIRTFMLVILNVELSLELCQSLGRLLISKRYEKILMLAKTLSSTYIVTIFHRFVIHGVCMDCEFFAHLSI